MQSLLKISFFLVQLLVVTGLPTSKERGHQAKAEKEGDGQFEVPFAEASVTIDGLSKEEVWLKGPWHSLNYRWMGEEVDSNDYYGAFKLAWDSAYLYILARIRDEVIHPMLADGLENYWKGDYLEVFLDADHSGGPHATSHQAFAYHIGMDGRAIDRSLTNRPIFFDDHVQVATQQNDGFYYWELAISIYGADFKEGQENNPLSLTAGTQLGFSLAYGDNDGHGQRENFMGSKASHGQNNDEGYTNADVFGRIILSD